MAVGIRQLEEHASAVVDEARSSGHPVLITRHGAPVAYLVAVDEDALLDFALAQAPEYVRDMAEAEEGIARGEHGRPLEDVLADLGLD